MLNVITGSLPELGQDYFFEKIEQTRVMLGDLAVSVVTGVSSYFSPPTDNSNYQPRERARAVERLPLTRGSLDKSLPDRESFHENCECFYPNQPAGNHRGLPSLYDPEDISGPISLPYLRSLGNGLLDTDESYPDEYVEISSAPRSIDPKSLLCFETASMIYIPGQFETLDISTVDIIEGGQLAQQLRVSGKVPVDKVFYEAGSGAIFAQVVLKGTAYTFPLFYIEIESQISFTAAQELKNKKYLKGPKQNVDMIYEVFRKRLKKKYSGGMTPDEFKRLFSIIAKKEPARPSIKAIKQYHCNNEVRAVTNSGGHDITEAIKNRMYQEEERLARNPELVKYQDKATQLNAVKERKKEWDATKRSAARLYMSFESRY